MPHLINKFTKPDYLRNRDPTPGLKYAGGAGKFTDISYFAFIDPVGQQIAHFRSFCRIHRINILSHYVCQE